MRDSWGMPMGVDDVPEGYWDSRPGDSFAEDTDVTIHWPWVRPCWEDGWA